MNDGGGGGRDASVCSRIALLAAEIARIAEIAKIAQYEEVGAVEANVCARFSFVVG